MGARHPNSELPEIEAYKLPNPNKRDGLSTARLLADFLVLVFVSETRRALRKVDLRRRVATYRAHEVVLCFGPFQLGEIVQGLGIQLGVLGFGCLCIVEGLDSVSVSLGASLLEKFRIHRIALVGFSLDCGFEVFLGRLDYRSLDLCLGCAAQILNHSGVVSGVNLLSLGCSPEQTRNFAVPFLIGFFCEREVARVGIAFAVEPSLQVVERLSCGHRPVWENHQGKREHKRTVSEILHTQYSPFQFHRMATCIEIARRREGHGVGQASAFGKLHRTNSKKPRRYGLSPLPVRRIGRGTSEPSDITRRLMSD